MSEIKEKKPKKVKKEKTKLQVWIENIVQIVIVVICLVFSIIVISNPGGMSKDYSKINVSSMPVLSHSMSGTFEKGDLIFGKKIKKGEILDIGEVAIFVVNDPNQNKYQYINTHRVVGYYYSYTLNNTNYFGPSDLLELTLDWKNTQYNTAEKVIEYATTVLNWEKVTITGYVTSGDNKAIYFKDDVIDPEYVNNGTVNPDKLKDKNNTNLVDNYYPSINGVIGKWTGGKLPGVGGVITWIQQPTAFFFVIIVPLILLFGYNVYIVVRYVIEVKTAKARKLALEEGKELSEEEKEAIKKKAIEEYLKSLEENKKDDAKE